MNWCMGLTKMHCNKRLHNDRTRCLAIVIQWEYLQVYLREHYSKMTLLVDILYINSRVPYLFAIVGRHIKIIHCLCIQNRQNNLCLSTIKKINFVYRLRFCFKTKKILFYVNRAFESCQVQLLDMEIDLAC